MAQPFRQLFGIQKIISPPQSKCFDAQLEMMFLWIFLPHLTKTIMLIFILRRLLVKSLPDESAKMRMGMTEIPQTLCRRHQK